MKIRENVSLKPYTSFGVEANAHYFVDVTSEEELVSLLPTLSSRPFVILGGGNNMLFTRNYEGMVVRISLSGKEVLEQTADYTLVRVAAGEDWGEFVQYCVNHNYGGIENLSAIPSKVGSVAVQNIGAYGVEAKDVIERVEAVDIATAQPVLLSNAECKFGYRDSVFKHELKDKIIITQVVFKLTNRPMVNTSYGTIQRELSARNIVNPSIREVREVVVAIRQAKLPDTKELGCAGSFFKNPVVLASEVERLQSIYPDLITFPQQGGMCKLSAGQLIEKCGWKGKRQGNVGVYDKQALVLVNYGAATGQEVMDLARQIQQDVAAHFGVKIEPEVVVI